jgi:hypothetical protein
VFEFIESTVFDRLRAHYLDDDEYGDLQQFMMRNPEAGAIVRGSGGVRKLRWRREGAGKRGGLRLIYFVRYQPNEFWMLTLYSKDKAGERAGPYSKTTEGAAPTWLRN